MANSTGQKTKLSKNILQMKFMQRTAIQAEKEEEEQRIVDDEHWVLDIPELKEKESKYEHEPSHIQCECLRFGRMSFKGFNTEIEKIMKMYDTEQDLSIAVKRENEISVNDEEMAERYQSLVSTIGQKFQKKRHRSEVKKEEDETHSDDNGYVPEKKRKKKKFMKPQDD